MSPTIRRATLDDLWMLRTMWGKLMEEQGESYPSPTPHDPDTITRYLAIGIADALPRLHCPVVEVDGQVVGFACGEVLSRPTGSPVNYGFLTWIWVDPAHRGQGLGRMLLKSMATTFAQVPTLTHVQLVARFGDTQWIDRGWRPFTVEHQIAIPDWLARLEGNGHTTLTPEVPDVVVVK